MSVAAEGLCGSGHYEWTADCTLAVEHDGPWRQSRHPDTAVLIRFRGTPEVEHTQEWNSWEPEDDRGEWVTLHYRVTDRTSAVGVPADLDQRVLGVAVGHVFTSRTRPGAGGQEEECSCGQWYPACRHYEHVGRQVGLLVRSYFDIGMKAGTSEVPVERSS
ncbi:hypothetical protein [Kitasatospora sp. NPDC002965]|uniref:hypothetical protein n=1 Tax=Kitasatospora sp. NPDC002965 TaxID=3154775 RepID=UPI0033B432EF